MLTSTAEFQVPITRGQIQGWYEYLDDMEAKQLEEELKAKKRAKKEEQRKALLAQAAALEESDDEGDEPAAGNSTAAGAVPASPQLPVKRGKGKEKEKVEAQVEAEDEEEDDDEAEYKPEVEDVPPSATMKTSAAGAKKKTTKTKVKPEWINGVIIDMSHGWETPNGVAPSTLLFNVENTENDILKKARKAGTITTDQVFSLLRVHGVNPERKPLFMKVSYALCLHHFRLLISRPSVPLPSLHQAEDILHLPRDARVLGLPAREAALRGLRNTCAPR